MILFSGFMILNKKLKKEQTFFSQRYIFFCNNTVTVRRFIDSLSLCLCVCVCGYVFSRWWAERFLLSQVQLWLIQLLYLIPCFLSYVVSSLLVWSLVLAELPCRPGSVRALDFCGRTDWIPVVDGLCSASSFPGFSLVAPVTDPFVLLASSQFYLHSHLNPLFALTEQSDHQWIQRVWLSSRTSWRVMPPIWINRRIN